VLGVRRRQAACFAPGARYEPLLATGTYADHVVAFARRPRPDGGDRPVTTVVSRFPLSRPDGWLDTAIDLPDALAHDVLDGPGSTAHGGAVRLADLLGDHPAAVLA
jgi:maltooligosyltrehalose synthase